MSEQCYLCLSPAELVIAPTEFSMQGRKVVVDATFYRCTKCGEEFVRPGMGDSMLTAAATEVRRQHRFLMPDEIRAIRLSYGLTQAGLEQLIGSGEKTVTRWEKGSVAQTATADTLLRVLRDHPDVVAKLAEERGVKVRLPKPPADAADPAAEAPAPEQVRHAA
jgi:putative zinc finger/helix-turn-helix YgiT family protein